MDIGKQILAAIERYPDEVVPYEDYFSYCREEKDLKKAQGFRPLIREAVARALADNRTSNAVQLDGLFYRTLLFGAKDCFDDYLQAVEYGKPYERQFYLPRRHYLLKYVNAYQKILDGKLDFLSISIPKRCGKAVTLDTLIPTPAGMVPMRDIHVGDMVLGADGKPAKVTDVFPQGKVLVYEVRFSDGAVVKTCAEHLWKVKYHDVSVHGSDGAYFEKIMTTGEMLRRGVKSGGKNSHSVFAVQYAKPAEFSHRSVGLDPYVLGVLLGDGTLRDGTIMLTTFDKEVSDYVSAHVPEGDVCYCQDARKGRWIIRSKDRKYGDRGYLEKSATRIIIEELGLFGHLAWEKFIPDDYLYTDARSRFELLSGLLDTDGCCSGNDIEYATTSPALRDAMLFLVRSLGGRAAWSERMGHYTKNGTKIYTRINYRVHIYFPDGVSPFKIARKKDRYRPKRENLYHYIDSITPCGEEEAQCICVDNEDHLFLVGEYFVPTHNSQLGINFSCMLSGRKPNRATLMEGAGDALVNSFYKGCAEYLDMKGEYHFYDIFPDTKLVQTDADIKILNLNVRSRFPTIMCRSVDARQVGLSEATNLLYLDDTVEGREEAKNRQRLLDKWDIINGDVLGRAIEGTPIVSCGTRYSVIDPMAMLQEKMRKKLPPERMEIIETPALDPDTDESNFEYVREGVPVFTTAYFRAERDTLSAEQWESEFQQQPFEAKGTLFPRHQLMTYKELPDTLPDAVIAYCDTAESGEDSTSMPVGIIYGTEVYIDDVVFSDDTALVTKPLCAKAIMENAVENVTFESNNAGNYYSGDVEKILKESQYICGVRSTRTISNKKTRIEFMSDIILKHFHFKHPSLYAPNSMYARFMRELTTYVRTGKVPHDDAPDSLAGLATQLRIHGVYGTVKVVDRVV